MMICAVSLAGCSKQSDGAKWDYGSISINGNEMQLTEYDGYTATLDTEEYTITYNSCSGPIDCPHKVIDVSKELMTKYNKSYYFTAFFDTMCEMYHCYDDKLELWNEGLFNTKTETAYPVATMLSLMEPVISYLPLDGSVTNVTVNDVVKIDVSSSSYKITDQAVVIPGYLKAGTDDGSITFDSTMGVGDLTVAYTASSKYNYYRWGDVIIQMAQGLNVTDYVTFLGES